MVTGSGRRDSASPISSTATTSKTMAGDAPAQRDRIGVEQDQRAELGREQRGDA